MQFDTAAMTGAKVAIFILCIYTICAHSLSIHSGTHGSSNELRKPDFISLKFGDPKLGEPANAETPKSAARKLPESGEDLVAPKAINKPSAVIRQDAVVGSVLKGNSGKVLVAQVSVTSKLSPDQRSGDAGEVKQNAPKTVETPVVETEEPEAAKKVSPVVVSHEKAVRNLEKDDTNIGKQAVKTNSKPTEKISSSRKVSKKSDDEEDTPQSKDVPKPNVKRKSNPKGAKATKATSATKDSKSKKKPSSKPAPKSKPKATPKKSDGNSSGRSKSKTKPAPKKPKRVAILARGADVTSRQRRGETEETEEETVRRNQSKRTRAISHKKQSKNTKRTANDKASHVKDAEDSDSDAEARGKA